MGLSGRYMETLRLWAHGAYQGHRFSPGASFIRRMWRHDKAQPQVPAAQKIWLVLFQRGEKGQKPAQSEIAAKLLLSPRLERGLVSAPPKTACASWAKSSLDGFCLQLSSVQTAVGKKRKARTVTLKGP